MTVRGPSALAAAVASVLAVLLMAGSVPAAGPLLVLDDAPSPGDFLAAQRASAGMPSPGAMERARAGAETLQARTRTGAPQLADADWRLEGPTSIGGRVVDLAVDPARANTIYAAAATGGVWRSSDAGTTFQPSWPDDAPQAMGALAIGSDGTLFAGTGEANPGGGSLVYGGNGIYRSRDGGASWQHVGLSTTWAIGRIAVDPTDPDTVFVAASGNLFLPGGQRGLYRSTDAGDTWELVLAGANRTTGAIDVAIDPSDPDRMFAAMWDHRRFPDLRRYGGKGSGVFRSLDGGDTWSRVDGLPSGSEVGRIGVAIAPLAPEFVYAVVIAKAGHLEGFYRSTNGGLTWQRSVNDIALSLAQATYGWWFGRVWVDPFDPLHVFAAGIELVMSFDGGLTWTIDPSTVQKPTHPDQHAMAWDPMIATRVYLGNDGGVYRSEVDGALASWTPALVQPFTQFYSVDVAETDARRIVGGAQDIGNVRSYGPAEQPLGVWNTYGNIGDGEENLIDPIDPSYVYSCTQYGNCSRSTDGGDTNASFSPGGARFNWFTPIEFDPGDPSVLYSGGDLVSRSDDRARTWTDISEPLSSNQGRDWPSYPFGTLTALGIAADARTIYAGLDEGGVWVTRNLGSHWQRIDAAIPDRWVTSIAVPTHDAERAIVTLSGYRSGANGAHVFRTEDAGQTWTDISGDLPDAPVNSATFARDGALVVATDVGVFVTADEAVPTWYMVGTLPLVPVTDLRWHEGSGRLYASTFGRGIYSVALPGVDGPAA